jgi:hypothetical protein
MNRKNFQRNQLKRYSGTGPIRRAHFINTPFLVPLKVSGEEVVACVQRSFRNF